MIFGWDSNDELYDFGRTPEEELFTGWHSGFPDTEARIIPDSGRINPLEEDIPFSCELKIQASALEDC